jgi:hypothetical protein
VGWVNEVSPVRVDRSVGTVWKIDEAHIFEIREDGVPPDRCT